MRDDCHENRSFLIVHFVDDPVVTDPHAMDVLSSTQFHSTDRPRVVLQIRHTRRPMARGRWLTSLSADGLMMRR